MYAYIKGTLEEVEQGQIILDHGGIGYRILTLANIMDALPSIGSEVKIYTCLSVKEDGVTLFGFLTREDLRLFQLLLKVNGIGPKGALGILSALTAEQLRFAVLSGDAKAIAKAPGIGAKTAQRIILELKDKLNLEDAFCSSKNDAADAGTDGNVRNEAAQALAALGYSASEALAAVSGLEISEGAGVEDVLKAALKQML